MGMLIPTEPLILQNTQKPPAGQEFPEQKVAGCQENTGGKWYDPGHTIIFGMTLGHCHKQDTGLHSKSSQRCSSIIP